MTYVLVMSEPGAAMLIHEPVLLQSHTCDPSCAATASTWSDQGRPAVVKAAGQYGLAASPSLPAAATTTRSSPVSTVASAEASAIGGWLSTVRPPSDRLITSTGGSASR